VGDHSPRAEQDRNWDPKDIHHHRGGVYRKCCVFTTVCIYTTKSSTPTISLFFLGPNPVVVYIFGVPRKARIRTWNKRKSKKQGKPERDVPKHA